MENGKSDGTRQEADGGSRRQKAEGRRQEAEGRRQKAGGGSQKGRTVIGEKSERADNSPSLKASQTCYCVVAKCQTLHRLNFQLPDLLVRERGSLAAVARRDRA